MSLCWVGLGLFMLLWPCRRTAERRLHALASRLGYRPVAIVRRRFRLSSRAVIAGSALLGVASAAYCGYGVGVAVAGVTAAGGGLALRTARRRAAARADAALATAVRMLCAELEAGGSSPVALTAASQVAGPWCGCLTAAANAMAHGDDPTAPLRTGRESGHPGLRAVVAAWTLADRTGVPLGRTLRLVEYDLAQRQRHVRDVGAAVAGARSSAGLLAGLPLLGVALGIAMGARPLAVLFAGRGQVVLAVGVLLDLIGVLWTARIVNGAERR